MQNLPESLIYLIVLAVASLASYLFKRFGPKMELEPPQAESDQGPVAQEPVPGELAAASIAPATSLPEATIMVAQPNLPSHPGGQGLKRARMGSKRNLQAAIAMATILGPCRAFEPDGSHTSSGR